MRLSANALLGAYCRGIFPMGGEDGAIYWYDPDPRAILPLDAFHVSRSLARTLRKGQFTVRIDSAFAAVIEACAGPSPEREGTWITSDIIEAYLRLHELGFAHSVESWSQDELVGGLYGVAVNGLFAGESMFSIARDASKVALVNLVDHLREKGYHLLDVQFMTEHLRRFGAVEIPRAEYRLRLSRAISAPVHF